MDDCERTNRATLQWLTNCLTPWIVDRAVGDMRLDSEKGPQLATYVRYNVLLEQAWLKTEHGVQCSGEVYEFPLHKHEVLTHLDPGNLVNAEIACGRQMCLPIFASMTDAEADRVIAALAAAKSHGLV